jgi:hypothetical protein
MHVKVKGGAERAQILRLTSHDAAIQETGYHFHCLHVAPHQSEIYPFSLFILIDSAS